MPSSPTEEIVPLVPTRPRREGWIKRMLPHSMFGRSLLIIITPLLLGQVIATWIFYDRHWNTVARRLASGVVGDIALVIDEMPLSRDPLTLDQLFDRSARATGIDYIFRPGETLPPGLQSPAGTSRDQLVQAFQGRFGRPVFIDGVSDMRDILISIELRDGVLQAVAPRDRLYTSTTYIFVIWMVGSSLVLFAVATLFMRNQVRSLRRMAAAAESFGKGRDAVHLKVEGATEVRQVATAFLLMRERIRRQIQQRTEMLAGVSHDLRTPLTRMKLALELMGEDPAVEELKSDVIEMERMVQGYLDFARGEGTETPRETDLRLLLDEVVAKAAREGASISLTAPEDYEMELRPDAMRRCLANLIGNARRHGSHIWVTAMPTRDGIDVLIDDDGPGIPPSQRDAVFRAFVRLDPSRNPSTGGVGLGLTIARDVARGHGGDLTLEDSPQRGLRARIHLPR